mgnify:CR=1 FL=1
MAIKVLGLHHHAVRIDAGNHPLETFRKFYSEVLGLEADPGRPNIAAVPGLWINVGTTTQIHLMGGQFPSVLAKVPEEDPVDVHVALAVEDIAAAKSELDRQGIYYWSLQGVAGPEMEQVFVRDPAGNIIELQQQDKRRWVASDSAD